jgi:hypothetical protein
MGGEASHKCTAFQPSAIDQNKGRLHGDTNDYPQLLVSPL